MLDITKHVQEHNAKKNLTLEHEHTIPLFIKFQKYNLLIVRAYSAFYREMAVNKLDFSFICWYWSKQTRKKSFQKCIGRKLFYGPRPFPIARDLLEI